ncbi:FecR domain-containing protein [Oxalobacteraceae sp. CFBP 13730]|nr:FecR domain-containing protein [Oxalobacteraceae sp. CFBP 13730]
MTHRFVPTTALFVLAAFSTSVPAQTVLQTDALEQGQAAFQDDTKLAEAPGRAGRISLVQGKVDIGGDVGAESSPAQLNWPITSRNLISIARGARTELRIGSTAIRLDGDSSLEVTELDDDSLRLRLHYGSVSVRVMNADVVPEFELRTAQATVRLTQPGRLRVDAERERDTSLVSVLDGEAQVDGAGASLTVRGGRAAQVREQDVRTLQAQRDNFDDWSLTRDQALVAAQSSRHIGTEMTGYEELDRYGSWSTSSDYGSLWTPQVAADWTPYRDGSWTFIAPWGWTWVDNAPWGYAPFHYGRWVQVRDRWAWAPGRLERRPVWSPALVGWVGGSNWNVGFQSRNLAAHGWYPLSPYDRYVPGYRLSGERLRRLNDWRQANRREQYQPGRHNGLTVVPRDQFGGRGPVIVPRAPRPNRPEQLMPGTPGSAPPPPLAARPGWNRDQRDRRDLLERANAGRTSVERPGLERPGLDRMQFEQQARERGEQERLTRERNNGERLARERMDGQERALREQGERERMGREFENRNQMDRMRFQVERNDRERIGRERMREQAERIQRQPVMSTNAPVFARPESRPDPRPDSRPDSRPDRRPESRPDPQPDRRPEPGPMLNAPQRPAAPPQMVAPPAPRPQPSVPAFAPPQRNNDQRNNEQRANTDARGVSRVER